ncbi:vanadium-dependent haloperoxidase [Clostridium sp.]|uniref:vanadium-dependent haloperoxidase n=1 Tax=Clostridium sp. TaxID=1506 RepID=UPI003F2F2D9B
MTNFINNNSIYENKNCYCNCCNHQDSYDCPNSLPCLSCPNDTDCHHCYDRWSKIPYPNETNPYVGIEKNAGSWPLCFVKFNGNGNFSTLCNMPIKWNFANPCSIDFNAELKEVEYVQANLTTCQIGMAKFWGTGVPVNQWTPITLTLINTYKVNPPMSAKILASVQNVINDAFVITWFYKYCGDFARPVQLNRNLVTLLQTPKFPTYPSGHSVVSGATSTVLSYFFPAEANKLNSLAEDASISRLYGGIHFRSDLTNGLSLGRQIGILAIEVLSKEVDGCCDPIFKPYTEFLDAPIVPKYC